MNQKITFATILVTFSVFFICFTNASPVELSPRSPGQVAYADFTKPMTGRVTVTELWGRVCRITAQFNTGFVDRTSKYEFQVSGSPRELIDSSVIFPPGSAPVQYDVKDRTIAFFIGKTLSILRNGVVIEKRPFILVG
ncbi:hypothetical protein Glove_219g55 [Diversispora epigaea]|uniref:Uncharacterized protein n=1 Tax=Diversispora epigaea TaxID=1348612 RepID=A0A397IP73_9GLOM|nr:hypothetical protein Glove_219g55 [Diversispora epigaea]